jgi:hypothetical protein
MAPKETPGRPRENSKGALTISRAQAANDAGLSLHQKREALRMAKIPEAEFEEAIESDDPPTVTALAERGTVSQPKPLLDLKGRNPAEFSLSTDVQGALRLRAGSPPRLVSPPAKQQAQ